MTQDELNELKLIDRKLESIDELIRFKTTIGIAHRYDNGLLKPDLSELREFMDYHRDIQAHLHEMFISLLNSKKRNLTFRKEELMK